MEPIQRALGMAGAMAWEVLWALILRFALSAVIQAVARRETIVRLLGDDRPRTLALAAGLGAASSSCSYAAVALGPVAVPVRPYRRPGHAGHDGRLAVHRAPAQRRRQARRAR
jgi:uncharacterized membrane protein YraQ (UPF0718 family)